jgi:transposase
MLPEKRLATLMADLFGVALVTATIARISQDCCRTLPGLCRGDPRPRGCGAGQASGRDRVPDWWEDAVAARRLDYRVSARRGSLLADLRGHRRA